MTLGENFNLPLKKINIGLTIVGQVERVISWLFIKGEYSQTSAQCWEGFLNSSPAILNYYLNYFFNGSTIQHDNDMGQLLLTYCLYPNNIYRCQG